MTPPRPNVAVWTRIAVGAALVLFAAATWVRGVEGARVEPPAADPEQPPPLSETTQFLSPGAELRLLELDAVLRGEAAGAWQASSAALFTLADCPDLLEWMNSKDGLALETHLRELRGGGEVEALAALTLLFRLARATDWDPGFLAHSESAERLAGLLEAWLRTWGDRAAGDVMLHEPAVHATLLYGRAMRIAYDAPLVGRDESALRRAQQNLATLLGSAGERTALGRAVQSRHPRATELLETDSDVCRGLAEDCATVYPDLDGECDS